MEAISDSSLVQDASPEVYSMWFLLGINSICIIISASVHVYGAYGSAPRLLELLPRAASKLHHCLHGLKHYCGISHSHIEDPFEAKVWALVKEARVKRGQFAGRIFTHVGIVISLAAWVFFGYYDLSVFGDKERLHWQLHQSDVPALVIFHALAIVIWLWPHLVSEWVMDLGHALYIGRLCWQVSASESVYQFLWLEHTNGALRFLAALGIGTPSVTLGLNVACSFSKQWM
eukprot:TRINITY_DN58260_c0_g1_i1.p1 TRINITY_DN58260_c0_g1~~TRINITY_DN58260_c0_g1_i1.p1  ORF type:complete len:231 (+),score=18.67 TRINITY_DN58260_c0_g1_i1:56-748(+)